MIYPVHGNTEATVRRKFEVLAPVLNERTLRLWAAAEAESMGRGGIKCVSAATRLSRINRPGFFGDPIS